MYHNYLFSFGYIPTGSPKKDLLGSIIGFPNLLKRIQAKDIMETFHAQQDEIIMDYGCGSSFFTYELAKTGAKTYGVDVLGFPTFFNTIRPNMKFLRVQANQPLPFADNTFDKIFMSEVTIVLDNPVQTFIELKRVLKPAGILYNITSTGRDHIRDGYKNRKNILLELSRLFNPKCPNSFKDYREKFFMLMNVPKKRWDTEKEMMEYFFSAGYSDVTIKKPYAKLPLYLFEWIQFINVVFFNRFMFPYNPIFFWFLELSKMFSRTKDPYHLIMMAKK